VADRRRRARTNAIALLASVRVAGDEREVSALDYHGRGLSFWWPEPLHEGSRVRVTLVFAGIRINDLEAEVRTCRRKGRRYRCGVRFLLPRENELETLRKLNAIEFRLAASDDDADSACG
jgi:hypothetical protein